MKGKYNNRKTSRKVVFSYRETREKEGNTWRNKKRYTRYEEVGEGCQKKKIMSVSKPSI